MGTLSEKKMAALRAKEFGFVFQQPHLVSNLTLFENVAIAGYLEKGKSEKTVKKRAKSLLAQMHAEKRGIACLLRLLAARHSGRPLPEL